MSKKICIAQSLEELKFILNKYEKNIICVPLDLEAHLYCMKNNLQFYNPINFIDSNFHRDALMEFEKLVNQIDMTNFIYDSYKKIYTDNIRFEFNSIIFLIELIEKINAYQKIDEIFVSGWYGKVSKFSDKDYFVSFLILNLISNIKVTKLTTLDKKSNFHQKLEKKYTISNKNLNTKRNYILQNSLGYNFSRTAFYLKKRNYYILIPVFKNDLKKTVWSFFKKKILRLFNVIFIEFIGYPIDKQNKPLLPHINFSYKGINLSKVFYFRFVNNLNEYGNMCNAVDILFDKFNIKLALSNMATGVNGYYLEIAKKKNIPSVFIPHGSISEYFNKFDKIFKKQIAELQFNKQSKFFAIQSKITKNFIESYNINHNCIETGNLLFSNNKNSKKNKIVFAVTLKSFEGLRYLGFEMYYEFLENLALLDKIAKERNMQFLVKLHPSANSCFNDLKERYKNLEFTKKKINKVLNQAFVTISFSSTVIEDSLYSNVPVILFDKWGRYKHCRAEENVKSKNSAVYYVNSENDLIDCIDTVKNSDNISFKEYIFEGNVKKNINNLVEKFL